VSDQTFEARLQRMFADHPHFPDAPLFAVEIEDRLSRGWAFRRLLIGAAGGAGGLIAVVQIAGAGLWTRIGAAGRLYHQAVGAVNSTAAGLPAPMGEVGQLSLPFGGEALWLIAGLAVLAGALLVSRSIQEL
jgi:hypothetical protein